MKKINFDETIAAIATSSKDGSISIIRVSGKESLEIVSKIFFTKSGKPINLYNYESHKIVYGFIGQNQNNIIDEVLVLLMKGPNSYTAEDVVEIHCHGGYLICQKILNLLLNNGAQIAQAGEFTKRAFLNGRIDLSQAEAVMDIINSKSEAALKTSINNLRGDIKDKIINLRNIILNDIAYMEAGLDDPEHISLDDFGIKIEKNATYILNQVNSLLDNFENGKIIKEGIKTAIVGKPNVGKSSFLNCILRDDRAIVTDIAGTTRDTLEEEVRIGSILLKLIDTAGIRDTDDKIEKIGIKKAFSVIDHADFIICVIDSSEEISQEDIDVLKSIEDKKSVIVLNKQDLKAVTHISDIEKISNVKIIPFSSETGQGRDELEEYIRREFNHGNITYDDQIYISNVRHKEALIETKNSLIQLLQSINEGMPEDLFSIDMVNAYESLGKIIGETLEDDIIDKIFKDFCMGK